jgi:pimeloyl-ACP methyl ester carboxylesterase
MSEPPAASPADRWFSGSGIRVHGLDWGGDDSGQLILMLHGVGGNAWVWNDLAPRLRHALPTHHVVAIDQRDGGDTDHPPTGYAREDFGADIDAVHDELRHRALILVGHSRGAWLASWYAATRPDRVTQLVLIDPARLMFGSSSDADSFYDWVRGGLGPFDSEEDALDWARAHDAQAVWTQVRRDSFLFGFRRMGGKLVGKLPPAVVDELRTARKGGEIVTEQLESIAAPTLLLVALRQSGARRNDKLAYAERIPNLETVFVDGSHFLHTDAPDRVAAAISRFVRASQHRAGVIHAT